MKNISRISILLFASLGLVLTITSSCKKDVNEQKQLPLLITSDISNISPISATCGGTISTDGGLAITSRGVCWSTSSKPTISGSKTSDGIGIGLFTSILDGLDAKTIYYVRAYATNSAGTVYGNEISFKTIINPEPIYTLNVIEGRDLLDMIKTTDGGYAGIARTNDDFEIVKYDADYNVVWSKTYGGSKLDYVQDIIQSKDGGYLVIGATKSSDGDVTLFHGDQDIWLCKLDADGNLIWNKCYGGTGSEGVSKQGTLLQTSDGGYIFAGYTTSADNDVTGNHGGYDVWVVKINATGSIEYQKTFGGSGDDFGRNIVKDNLGYALLTSISSDNGDFNAKGMWIIQINETGDIVWKTNLFGINTGFINTTSDGGLVVVNSSFIDYSFFKLSAEGNVEFTKTINLQSISTKQPDAQKIVQTNNGGYFVAGSLLSSNNSDAILFRLAPDFSLLYNKLYNGNDFDMSASFIPLGGNKYMYHFISNSTDIPGVTNPTRQAAVIVTVEEN